MRVVPLALEHETALADFLEEFRSAGDEVHGWFADPSWPHERVVEAVDAWSRGEQLGEGWVPCTTLFLEEDGVLLGLANLRHSLTEGLLRYGGHVGYAVRPSARGRGHATRLLDESLRLAKRLGVDRALLTVAPDNHASIRVILKNGGEFEDRFFHEEMEREVERYWIDLETRS